jgi:hypothetical protein
MTNPSAGGEGPNDRTAAVAYIADLSGTLASMARRHGFDTLGYILEMAKLEAENACGHLPLKDRPKAQS